MENVHRYIVEIRTFICSNPYLYPSMALPVFILVGQNIDKCME